MKMLEGLPYRHFRVITADPPWDFKSNSKAKPGRNARRHYKTMSLAEIRAMPVEQFAAENSVLFFWITGPLLVQGAHIPIMRSWGFEPTAMGFDWIKLNPNSSSVFFTQADIFKGGGFTTRKNAEYVVLGKRGRSVRENAGVSSVLISPRREHSQKPEDFHKRVMQYTSGPYLELFGRQQRDGWTVRGDQADKFPKR